MIMQNSNEAFESEWFMLAEKVCERIYRQPEIQEMKNHFTKDGRLTEAERSNFIAIANRVKYDVIHEQFGDKGSQEFEEFRKVWLHWFNNKKGTSEQLHGRRLTNAEHIVYSSTPDPDEFMSNFK